VLLFSYSNISPLPRCHPVLADVFISSFFKNNSVNTTVYYKNNICFYISLRFKLRGLNQAKIMQRKKHENKQNPFAYCIIFVWWRPLRLKPVLNLTKRHFLYQYIVTLNNSYIYVHRHLLTGSFQLRSHCSCYITKHNSYVFPLVNYHAVKYTCILNFNTW
jgi:hypothetical protein